MLQPLISPQKRRTSCFGFGNGWESFGNTHPKGSHLKMTHPLSIADLPVYIWLRATYIGRIRT